MSRILAPLAFVVLALAAIAGGFLAETTGAASEVMGRVFAALPSGAQDEVERIAPQLAEGPTPEAGATGDDAGATDDAAPEVMAEGPVPPPPAGLFWGVHLPDAPFDPTERRDFVRTIGSEPAIVMWFQEWAGEPGFPVDEARALAADGIVPMITWEAWEPPPASPSLSPEDVLSESRQPDYRLSRVVAGEFDDYLRRYAEQVRDAGVHVMLRPFHEMNGFWYPWGGTVNGNRPADVVAAWRHVHDVFEDVGATNVTWVWSVNHRSLPDRPTNRIASYWPGEAYVDWVGLSGFNFGDTSEVSSWRSMESVVDDALQELRRYDLPIVLAETATVHRGGDEGEWISEAFAYLLEDHPLLDAIVWFEREVEGVRDFRLTSSPAAQEAFQDAIDSGAVLGGPRAYPSPPAGSPS